MARHVLKMSSLATAALASSGVYLYGRQLDVNDLSVVRFGRAAAAVSGLAMVSANRVRTDARGQLCVVPLKGHVMPWRDAPQRLNGAPPGSQTFGPV